MKTKLTLAILTLVCAVCVSAVPQSKPQTWEYKFEYKCNEKRLNDLASQGWELASYAPSPISGGSMALDVCVVKKAK